MKNKETLEEAAEKYAITEAIPDPEYKINCKEDFIAGAKWQLSQISDNDIDDWIDYRIDNPLNKISFIQWFEQYKKK